MPKQSLNSSPGPTDAELKLLLSEPQIANELAGRHYNSFLQYSRTAHIIEESEDHAHLAPDLREIIKLMEDEIFVLGLIRRGMMTVINTAVVDRTFSELERRFNLIIEHIDIAEIRANLTAVVDLELAEDEPLDGEEGDGDE